MNQAEYAQYRVAVALAPVRSEPSQRAEQTSQWHWQQKVLVTDQKPGWFYCTSQRDGYQGWVGAGQLSVEEVGTGKPPSCFVQSRWAHMQNGAENIWVSHGCTPHPNTQVIEGVVGGPLPGTPESICDTASLYLGTPYLWGGTSIWGIDCSGLIQQIFTVHGIDMPRDAWQQAQIGHQYTGQQETRAGDLAFFSNEQNRITHVGLVLGDGLILHASEWVRIDRLNSDGIERATDRQKTHRLAHFCRIL